MSFFHYSLDLLVFINRYVACFSYAFPFPLFPHLFSSYIYYAEFSFFIFISSHQSPLYPFSLVFLNFSLLNTHPPLSFLFSFFHHSKPSLHSHVLTFYLHSLYHTSFSSPSPPLFLISLFFSHLLSLFSFHLHLISFITSSNSSRFPLLSLLYPHYSLF